MEPKEGKMTETPSSTTISTKLRRIADQARKAPELAFTTLAHHIDIEFLHEAYRRTRKGGATGVDGQSAAEYAKNLEANLQSLLDRAKSGRYRAPPVRRVHIPKGDGSKTRPIGVPTFEDKVLQRAVAMLLEPIYEQDFVPWSFGFRRGRSAHQALQLVQSSLMDMGGGWVLEVDIQSFFDELVHAHLRDFLRLRVRDGVLLRLLGKWLAAGVFEDGALKASDSGTPQGGVVSPILANVYLHHVFDRWFEDVVRPRLGGRAVAVRYADDIVIVCSAEADARRVMKVLPKRFERFGLRLHPDKTRLVDFRRPPDDGKGPGGFDLLGFTHYWARSQQGRWVVRRKTARDRFTRTLRRLWCWCRDNRHLPLAEQHEQLCKKLKGHDEYYGLVGNARALWKLRHELRRMWRYWLNRRSQRARMTWERFARLCRRFPLPRPTAHSRRRRAANP